MDITQIKHYVSVAAEINQQGELVLFPCQRRLVTYDAVRRADPAYTQPCSFPGRVGPQQQHCDRFNLWRLGFTIAIHPLIRQHFVEIYHCHWSEGTLSRWIGELWMRMVASNLQFCLSSPLPSFIVALFCAAAIFNRLVLHSHPCRLTVL